MLSATASSFVLLSLLGSTNASRLGHNHETKTKEESSSGASLLKPSPLKTSDRELFDLPDVGDIADCSGWSEYFFWNPEVLEQIEGKELPECNGGCGEQPPIYGCTTMECRFYFAWCEASYWANEIDELTDFITPNWDDQ